MANIAPLPQPDARGSPTEPTPLRPRDTVGSLLRRTRMEQGGDLEAIASHLRIRAAYLGAIEQGRTDRLPGAVYALGFVRSYAAHLGLDSEEAVRRFKLESAGLEQRRDLSFPVPLTQRSIPGGRVLLLALVLAVCAYFFWQYLSTEESSRPERVAAVPSDLMPPPPAPPPVQSTPAAPDQAGVPAAPSPDQTVNAAPTPPPVTAAALPPPGQAATLVAPPPPPLPSADLGIGTAAAPPAPPPPPPVVASLPPPAAAAPPPPAAPVPTPAASEAPSDPHVFGAVAGPSRITLRAVKDCWILVRDSDPAQTVVAQRTLHAGDSYRVPERVGLTLRTGNATGLEVLVDDKAVPPLGGTVRNVALDPTRLLAGTVKAE
jgi:cytoskeleton protein RodZ